MARMKRIAMFSAAAALSVTLAAPAAGADAVDDYLAKIPAGQISCDTASKYWTNASDYNSKKQQALLGASFHPRGAEIRDAVARMDEAIARCGLNGVDNTAARPAQPAPAPQQAQPALAPAPQQNQPAPAPKPAAAPAQQPSQGWQVIEIAVIPGKPTVDIPLPAFKVIFRVPDVAKIAGVPMSSF